MKQVYAEYASKGYSILAITEHDRYTRGGNSGFDPLKEFGILPVAGKEYSEGRNLNGYFFDYATKSRNMEVFIKGIENQGGVTVLNHPGRYLKCNEKPGASCDLINEYVRMMQRHPSVLGIEVINTSNRNAREVSLWDDMLSISMPERPVWGFANDDMHDNKHIGLSWEVFLLDSLDDKMLRNAMSKGRFYFCQAEVNRDPISKSYPPVIVSLRHDSAAKTITISAAADGRLLGVNQYRWVSKGRTVSIGPVLAYGSTDGIDDYVRAEMTGLGGTTYTNPFGFSRTDDDMVKAKR